jgi:large subunit ribosomal protein L4
MAILEVFNKKGEKAGTVKLDEKVFNGRVNKSLLQQVITMYLANQRKGTAQTKTRGEVRGGGRKPWRQKGTGRARHGSIRSPIWRGGGTIFGPHPKDWHYQMPKKMKRLALLSALNAKLKENGITVIDDFKLESHKTKGVADILKNLKLNDKKLIVIPNSLDENLKRATHNIEKVTLCEPADINAYEVLSKNKMLIEKAALENMEKNLNRVA